ncbi:MAG TPA: hypothetical protein VGP93_08850 [Polyangiaceae bacterium]|nr:hypothetical protein [Polyangiaceae bacterium]
MQQLSKGNRLVFTGALCSAMVTCAGVIALQGKVGVLIASVLLTATFIVALTGGAYSSNRTLGVGVLVLIAAAFPLFVGLYVVGVEILKRLGSSVAGGLLIGLGAGLALASTILWLGARRHGTAH